MNGGGKPGVTGESASFQYACAGSSGVEWADNGP